jgi:hypothetical protein
MDLFWRLFAYGHKGVRTDQLVAPLVMLNDRVTTEAEELIEVLETVVFNRFS